MKSLFIISLPRSLTTKLYEAIHQTLGFKEPIWTSCGEIMNNDRFVQYKGEGYDEGLKFTQAEKEPQSFERLLAFLNETTIKEGYIYKDVIQPFVLSAWLPNSDFCVLKIKRRFADIVYSMTINMSWFYSAQAAHIYSDQTRAVIEGLIYAEQALGQVTGESVDYENLIYQEAFLNQALRKLYPEQTLPPVSYIDHSFLQYKGMILQRRQTAEYQALEELIEEVREKLQNGG